MSFNAFEVAAYIFIENQLQTTFYFSDGHKMIFGTSRAFLNLQLFKRQEKFAYP